MKQARQITVSATRKMPGPWSLSVNEIYAKAEYRHQAHLWGRRSNYQVVAANHTLVLNWNAQTVPLLRQIAINRTERGEGAYSGCAALSRHAHQ